METLHRRKGNSSHAVIFIAFMILTNVSISHSGDTSIHMFDQVPLCLSTDIYDPVILSSPLVSVVMFDESLFGLVSNFKTLLFLIIKH